MRSPENSIRVPEPGAKAEWIDSALARYEAPLLRYATRLLGDVDRAQDVVQDTFLRLCREDPARLDGHLAEWLFTVCRNRARDVRRKDSRSEALDAQALAEHPSVSPTPVRLLEQQEDAQEVLALVLTLPRSQQEVVRLKFQDGLSYREISAVTGLTVNHVGVLVHNALAAMRARFRAPMSALRMRKNR
jgi:RNA polymerase sigma-70 factor (ECF subfamily)